jgi:hypothetical protein
MIEVAHCAEAPVDLARFRPYATHRPKFPAWLAVLATLAFVLVWRSWIPILLGIASAVIHPIRSARRAAALGLRRIEIEGLEIVDRDASGAVVGRIRFDRPFTFEHLSRAAGFAICRLRQADQRVELSSEAPLAEPIARDLLCQAWPPSERLGT